MSERDRAPGILRRAALAYRRGGFAGLAAALRRRSRLARLQALDPDAQYAAFLYRHFPHGPPNAAPCNARWTVFVIGDAPAAAATEESLRHSGAWPRIVPLPQGAPLPAPGDSELVTAVAAGDRFVRGALAALTGAARCGDGDTFVYADEDRLGATGTRIHPFLKPGWSPVLSLTLPGTYPGSPAAMSAALFETARKSTAPGESWASVALRAAEAATRVVHLPVPLLSRPSRDDDPLLGDERARLDAARASLVRRGWPAQLEAGARPGTARFAGPPATRPRISVIVPTRDLPDLLLPLADELVRRRSDWGLELIFVDHRTEEPRALARLKELAASGAGTVVRDDGPFNYSRLVNRGVREASGELLLLLNNDVELPSADWLTPLVRALLLPGVAAAGTMLRYPDGTLQHGGIALGVGVVAGHPGKRGALRTDLPWVPADVAREVSAVTGACLLLRRQDFTAVGGLDEAELGVSFNDVDLCLRLRATGRRVLIEPAGALIHHETKTRDPEVDPAETRAVQTRHGAALDRDFYSSPGAFRLAEEPHLELWPGPSFAPRIARGDGTPLDAPRD